MELVMAEVKSIVQIGMIGFGNVGQGLYRLLEKNRTLIEAKIGAQIRIKRIMVKDLAKAREVATPEGMLTDKYEDILNDPDIDVVLELMGGYEPARTYLLDAMKKGKHIVTANKAVVSVHWDELIQTAREQKVDI